MSIKSIPAFLYLSLVIFSSIYSVESPKDWITFRVMFILGFTFLLSRVFIFRVMFILGFPYAFRIES